MIQVCIHMYLDVFAYYFDFFLDVNSCTLHIVSVFYVFAASHVSYL